MAKVISALPLQFTGKLGDVVGYMQNGVHRVRKAPRPRSNLPTAKEQVQREKFRLIAKLLNPIAPLLNKGFGTSRKDGFPKAFSVNYKQIFLETCDGVRIDFEKVQLSSGILLNPLAVAAASHKTGKLIFFWKNEEGLQHVFRFDSDQAFVAIYCEELGRWIYRFGVAERGEERCVVDATAFAGKLVHAYIGFIRDKGWISESLYGGRVRVR